MVQVPFRLITKRTLINFSTKETMMMMIDNNQVVDREPVSVEEITDESDTYSTSTPRGNGLSKVAISALVGATLGAIAGALAIKGTAERVNQTVKNVGETVKDAAQNLNQTVKGVGDAVRTVADGVNDTAKDVGDTVKDAVAGVNQTVQGTVDAVKGSAVGVNQTVRSTVDAVKDTVEDVKPSGNKPVKVSDNQQLFRIVPVEDE